jgi:hypothetical protein
MVCFFVCFNGLLTCSGLVAVPNSLSMVEKWGANTRLWQFKNWEVFPRLLSLWNRLGDGWLQTGEQVWVMVADWGDFPRLLSLWNRLGGFYRRYNLLLNRSVDPVEKRSFFICCFRTGILLNTNPVFDGE